MNTQARSILLDAPEVQNAGTEILAWDGRLDNHEDLGIRLRSRSAIESGDAALALAMWQQWGAEGLAELIGDWSLVMRDGASRSIILASDFAGVRPLYYNVQPGRVAWSGCLESLVEATGISQLDEPFIGGFLLQGGCPNRTPYKNIYSVPPGHMVRVSAERTTIRAFWELPCGDAIRYRDEGRYEDRFRELFREAVAVRLRTDSPVLAELSGGLDSSSVVSMANELVRKGAVGAPKLATVSYLWRDSRDEPFIREVESFCGIEGEHISTHDTPLISETQAGSGMPAAYEPLRESVARAARRLGAKVFLTGQSGDLVTGNWMNDSLQVAGPLRNLRLGKAFKDALAWSKILSVPIYPVLWRGFQAALPAALAPAGVYEALDCSYAPRNIGTSLLPRFCKRAGAGDPDRFFSKAWMQAPPERRRHFRALSMMLELRSLQVPEPLRHLDYTHPFAHRPLVEFLMRVPAEVLCRPGEPRKLMRSALADLWPARLRRRRSKSLFHAPMLEALRPLAADLLKKGQLQVVERGFTDRENVLSRLKKLSAGLDCNHGQLRQIILLELWLRNREERRPAGVAPQAA